MGVLRTFVCKMLSYQSTKYFGHYVSTILTIPKCVIKGEGGDD